MKPAISIVIPLYNKERHIEDTLDSIFGQSYTNYEIIVVNDGSTDGSLEIVKKIRDGRIKIHSIKNSGVSYARNYGILQASHQLVAFLDADDLWLPNHLEDLMDLYETFPDCGLYCTSYLRRLAEHDIRPQFQSIPQNKDWKGVIEDYFKSSMVFPVAWTSAVMIPKRIFNLVGTFDTSITLGAGEDTDLWMRIAKDHQVALIDRPSAIHNLNSDNRLSNSITSDRVFLNLDKFSTDAEANNSLSNYLQVQRFSIALQYKMAGDVGNFQKVNTKINHKALSWKQRFLLLLPRGILLKLRDFQQHLLKRNIYLSAFR